MDAQLLGPVSCTWILGKECGGQWTMSRVPADIEPGNPPGHSSGDGCQGHNGSLRTDGSQVI